MFKNILHTVAFTLLIISLTIVAFIQGSKWGQYDAYELGVRAGKADANLCDGKLRITHNGEVIDCKDLD